MPTVVLAAGDVGGQGLGAFGVVAHATAQGSEVEAVAEVDAHGRTSLPGVFAAGDATTAPYKEIIIAMGEGSKAALGAFDHLIRASAPAEQAAAA